MIRCPRNLPAAVALLTILIVAGGCSQSTKSGQKTNTGVLTMDALVKVLKQAKELSLS